MSSWKGKLNQPFKEKQQLRKHYQKPTWKVEEWNRNSEVALMSLIETSNLGDRSYNWRINGQIRLQERRLICLANCVTCHHF